MSRGDWVWNTTLQIYTHYITETFNHSSFFRRSFFLSFNHSFFHSFILSFFYSAFHSFCLSRFWGIIFQSIIYLVCLRVSYHNHYLSQSFTITVWGTTAYHPLSFYQFPCMDLCRGFFPYLAEYDPLLKGKSLRPHSN